AMGAIDVEPMRFLRAGIALVIVLESIMAGRVMPMFMMNAIPGLRLGDHRRRDAMAIVLGALGLALWACAAAPRASALALALAAMLHFARLLSWSPRASLQRPLLWILQFSYAWIPAGLALLAAAEAGVLPASAGVHALTVGSMGGLI